MDLQGEMEVLQYLKLRSSFEHSLQYTRRESAAKLTENYISHLRAQLQLVTSTHNARNRRSPYRGGL